MSERKYQLGIGELIDLLSITLLKSVNADREVARAKMKLIMDDIATASFDYAAKSGGAVFDPAKFVYAIQVDMLANATIWWNEAIARRTGRGGRLRFTHSINGVRTRAKNEIAKLFGEPIDEKVDCLAADLPEEFGNWRVFDD